MGVGIICAVFICAFLCHVVAGGSILAVFSSLSYSDHLVYRAYVSLLAQRGHSVVVMTPYPGHFSYPDSERIVELDVGQESAPYWTEYKMLMTNTDDYFPRLRAMNEFSLRLAIAQIKSKQMTALLINPNIKFDLVITEADIPFLYAVPEKYEAPHIAITTSCGRIHQHEAKGNPIHPIYYPDVNSLNLVRLSNWQKIVEYYRHIQTKIEYYTNFLPLCELAAKKLLGMKRDLKQVEYDIDLLFIANNPTLIGNRPSVPATVYVDRMHMKPGLHLPQDLKTFLDKATNGVVYFSLGVIQESEELATSILYTLTEAFRELPFTILWKIGNTTMINKPDNVMAHAWFPQQQVLAHPNVKAFITHGGPRSLEEALFYQVPIIGLPIVKSRSVSITALTDYGAGEILDPYYLDKETLKSAITGVVTNEKYKIAIRRMSHWAYDGVISGPEDAVWWTEYVLRHGEAKHLQAPTVDVSFFKYYLFDVVFFLSSVAIILITLICVMLLIIWKRLRARFTRRARPGPDGKFKAL